MYTILLVLLVLLLLELCRLGRIAGHGDITRAVVWAWSSS